MRSTFLSLHYHVVFSTKRREPFIEKKWRSSLHAFLCQALKNLGVYPLRVGGMGDHVHILMGIESTHRLCDVLQEIKHTSSQWIHESIGVEAFQWQDGYAAFTVSPSHLSRVSGYIAHQEEHHQDLSFEQEMGNFARIVERYLVQ